VHLFDVYKGEQVNEGYQGMAFSITYQSANRTLIDQEVNDLHEKIVTVLERDLKVIIRK
jgi:phenylalanyl-tRNA synthetase beta chain